MTDVLLQTTDPEDIPRKEPKTLKVVEKPPFDNWLKKLPVGTNFISRPKDEPPFQDNYICDYFKVIFQYSNATALNEILTDDTKDTIVDTYLFSKGNILVEVTSYGESNS